MTVDTQESPSVRQLNRAQNGTWAVTHGMCGSRTYRCWRAMKDRCKNKSHRFFKNYGGRGISVDKEWMQFENFYRDMGECPEGYSLDRIDVNGGYCKSNCRWANASTQGFNTRKKSHNKSGKSGVFWCQCDRKWGAQINFNKRRINLGRFNSKEAAIAARVAAELKYFGVTKE